MKRETLRELGKGFINLGNIVGGFSGLYSLFHIGNSIDIKSIITIIISVIGAYGIGALLINKGSEE